MFQVGFYCIFYRFSMEGGRWSADNGAKETVVSPQIHWHVYRAHFKQCNFYSPLGDLHNNGPPSSWNSSNAKCSIFLETLRLLCELSLRSFNWMAAFNSISIGISVEFGSFVTLILNLLSRRPGRSYQHKDITFSFTKALSGRLDWDLPKPTYWVLWLSIEIRLTAVSLAC